MNQQRSPKTPPDHNLQNRAIILVFIFVFAVTGANLLVQQIGPNISIVTAFFLVGLGMTTRGFLQECWGPGHLTRNMIALTALGCLGSLLINRDTLQLVIGSGVGMAAALLAGTWTHTRLAHRSLTQRINGANLASAFADSLFFPLIAFGWPPLVLVICGQFIAKVLGGYCWSVVLKRVL